MKKTVAIIGSHPRTREDFDFTREDCDIWVFNEALSGDWCKRATGVFQIHKPVIWRSSVNRNDPKHYEWLKSGDTPVVFMQDRFDDVPKSERYPLDEILAEFPRRYITSSVAFALALAIYKKYERIELYGIGMESQTEYFHQRYAVYYWIGVADGKGIKVDVKDPFFESPLYAYEGEARIPLEHYQKRIEHFDKFCQEAEKDYKKTEAEVNRILNGFIKSYKVDISPLEKLIPQMGQIAHNFGAVDGGKQINELYLSKCEKMQEETGSYLIVKQEYEGAVHQAAKALQTKLQEASAAGLKLDEKFNALYTNLNQEERTKRVNEFIKTLEKWVKTNTESGVMNGTQTEGRYLMAEIDRLVKMAGGEDAAKILQEAG